MSETSPPALSPAEVRSRVEAGCADAEQQWGVRLRAATLVPIASARLGATAPSPIEPDALASPELCLVLASVHGDRGAQEALDRIITPHVHQVISGLKRPAAARDDAWQLARMHLWVGLSGAGPALARYSGRGSLIKWVRVTTRRALINATRRKEVAGDALEDDGLVDHVALRLADPNRSALTTRYQEAFRRAFRRAAGDLAVRDRALIRHVVIDELTVRQVGRIFDVHHATAARWVAQAYARLVESTRERLAAALADDARGVDDVLSLIKSRLDVSFAAFAADTEEQ